jgi:TolB-like protein
MRKLFLLIVAVLFLQINLSADEMVEPRYIRSSDNDAGILNQLVSTLADQLTQNKDFGDIGKLIIAITSFVSVDNLKTTSRISNILSENLIHEMQVRGYKVIDFKTMDKIKIDPKGDFLFSRDISTLQTSLNVDYALTGTYTEFKTGSVVNARMINLKTHIVFATAQIFIPKSLIRRISRAESGILDFMPNKIGLSN